MIFDFLNIFRDMAKDFFSNERKESKPIQNMENIENKQDPPKSEFRKWRLTTYHLAFEDQFGKGKVPLLDASGRVIKLVSNSFFSSLSLEGSGILEDGRLVNVTGGWVKVKPDDFQSVLDYHKKFLSKRPPTYSGLLVGDDGRVSKVLSFKEIAHNEFGKGFGVCNGIELDPFRTVAADLGRTKKSDPQFKGKGGVVPVGTRIFIPVLRGRSLPDGTVHDGFVVAADTGGGIVGAHFDVFVGRKENLKNFAIPSYAEIWFEGIDKKLPADYDYGLKDA